MPNFVKLDAAIPAMLENTLMPFPLPSVHRRKVTAAFDGGPMTSNGGVMLLAAIKASIDIAARPAPLIGDPRNPAFVTHSVADILRACMLAFACRYEDGHDLDHLYTDPGFKLACGRLPDSGRDPCSQPTVSRWESAPDLRQVSARVQRLGPARLGVDKVGCRQGCHRDLRLVQPAGGAVDQLHGLPGIVDEQPFAGRVGLAHRRRQSAAPSGLQVAEPAVAAALRLPGPIRLAHHPGSPQLGVYPRPVRLQPGRLPPGEGWAEQLALQRRVVQLRGNRPGNARHAGAAQILRHSVAADPDHRSHNYQNALTLRVRNQPVRLSGTENRRKYSATVMMSGERQ
ncbi:MAG: transposase [Rhodospirillales bacterium]|nr:transposase [Rhodospirillales bacterium]